jgi:hypothetical protein
MGAVVQRGPHGHFLPGQSGNAGGRPASLARVRELLRPHTEKYVETLVTLLDDPDPAVRLAACREFGDRYTGKPTQSVESDVRHTDVGQTIRELYLQAVSGQSSAPPTMIEEPVQQTRIIEGRAVSIADAMMSAVPPGHDGGTTGEPW